ncbi:MAG: hypothetical protein A2527_07715 [Candidatus Lambdaproteobacteria bacterium RIFOXYD2_FULL_50_16]|uniref:Glycoside hydrolase family 57 N-terminal domain-containing protein n=1 Tax=Candidatus Lambdaproteobacteria bacterium RIFOXYD2_FULL_50_16 TaxID=1817772 RepID=A0A1F6GBA0_9PROT|nr:MAG: hypothetical protein A2527_07715 [Candidatus Lambdaproteobacteria bacterium RIFOXYD2_FULL_50_16]
MDKHFSTEGMTLIQKVGPFVELFFDFTKLPGLNLAEEYFTVRAVPSASYLPVEWARPNSEGPLFFGLRSGTHYNVELLRTPHLRYRVESQIKPLPWVDLIMEHENLCRLVWGNLDLGSLGQGKEWLLIEADGKQVARCHIHGLPEAHIRNRPNHLKISFEGGSEIFRVETNLNQTQLVARLQVDLEKRTPDFIFSKVTGPSRRLKTRAEIEAFFDMDRFFVESFRKKVPNCPAEQVGGLLRFIEDGKPVWEVRQSGYAAKPNLGLIDQIQTKEWGLEKALPVKAFRVGLQITTRHRETYRFTLIEKQFDQPHANGLLAFGEEEIGRAKARLAETHPHSSWDQAFLELVFYFKVEGHPWQEFQRESAHNTRWDWEPGDSGESYSAEWVLFDLADPSQELVLFRSGQVHRDHFKPKVVLKPHNDRRLLVWWELERPGVEKFIKETWGVGLDQVGFYLKLHEEHLGNRTLRPDLETPIVDLLGIYQNLYIDVEPNRCYSAEIVARHHHMEAALTPVSGNIVTPRGKGEVSSHLAGVRPLGDHWHHPSQREVRQNGHDSANRAKVMLHLHMHSPNLFRVEPFRDSYLKDVVWPIRTPHGEEVHNPPGEWALKNCLDAWLPLLMVFKKLADEGVDYQCSLDISPPVAYMISHPRFKDYLCRLLIRMQAHTQSQIALMKSRLEAPAFIWAAQKHLDQLKALDFFYNQVIHKDMIGQFRALELSGFLEISTCTATHGMPACLESMPDSLDAQLTLAARAHHRIFGDRPRGIWLAENSCFPSVDRFLDKEGLHYYFVEAEAALSASSRPGPEEFNPLVHPESNVVAFGRSRMGRVQVWDAEIGYAGHPDFREYHHRHWGLPLKRITSKTSEHKEAYDPDRAHQTAREMAQDFYKKLCSKAGELEHWEIPNQPLITCTYDAELFGHHWAEGPVFIEELLREFNRVGDYIGLTTPSHYLVGYPSLPEAIPNPSTWGHESTHIRWTDPKVAWTQRELERADGIEQHYLGRAIKGELNAYQKELVEQMGVELNRAISSDLTFVIISGDFEEDMQREIQKYLDYFYKLKYLIDNGVEDQEFLAFRRYENDMFPEIKDYYRIR